MEFIQLFVSYFDPSSQENGNISMDKLQKMKDPKKIYYMNYNIMTKESFDVILAYCNSLTNNKITAR